MEISTSGKVRRHATKVVLIVCMLVSAKTYSQNTTDRLINVNGKVTNLQKEPLAGATVELRKGKKATLTNAKGSFELRNVPADGILEVSYLGYQESVVGINDENELTIQLSLANSQLDQVQVIAYGNTTQRLNVGNVTTISGDDIQKQPVGNPLLALEGRVPGLAINQINGLPGTSVSAFIQGPSSIQNGNDPFYVIDGVPFTSELLPNWGSGVLGNSGYNQSGNGGNPLSYINPADIESISILKDADATAIYGSRAANGAILITTKKGKPGPTSVNLNLQNGWGKVTRELHLMNTPQYLEMRHEAIANDGQATSPGDYDINGTWDTTRYTNWQKALIGGAAQYANLTGSVSGGNDNTQYLVSGTFNRQTTVFPGDFYDNKGAVHFNVNTISANDKFHFTISGNYLIDNNHLPFNDLTSYAVSLAPDAPLLYNKDGSVNWAPTTTGSSSFGNPIASLSNTYQTKGNNLVSNVNLMYQVMRGIELKCNLGYTNVQTNELVETPFSIIPPEQRAYSIRSAAYSNNDINSWIVEPQAEYKQVFGKGKLGVLIGGSVQQNNSNGSELSASGFNSDAVLGNILAATNISVVSTTIATYKYFGAFGRVDYSYDDKYIIGLTTRRDGSSRFGSANEFHNFGSIGGAWIFTKEEMITNLLHILSFGKLRASYGSTGNDQIGDYKYLSLYNTVSVQVPYQGSTGLAPNGLPNPYLQWEETKKVDLGLDLGFLRDRVIATFDYARNRSSNQLLLYGLPIIAGFTGINQNFPATVQNTSIEITVHFSTIKTKDFEWATSFNITIPNNKIVAFPDLANSSYANNLVIGQPFNIIKVYHFLGVNSSTGAYQVADVHGTPTVNPDPLTDEHVLININPKYYGGFDNSFTYKRVQLSFLLQFTKQSGSNFRFGNSLPGVFNTNEPINVLERWRHPGNVSTIQKYNSDYSLFGSYANAENSDAGFSDASFIRFKHITLSYTAPVKLQRKTTIKNCRIYMEAENLFTLTRYIGMDPETKSSSTLPPLRMVTFGVQLEL